MSDYKAFKAAGICAPRVDDGVLFFQSGVTSVDPATSPEFASIARRRFADFVQDTLAARGKKFSKKLTTKARRTAMTGEIRSFCEGLLSSKNPSNQRIEGYLVDEKTGNTVQSLAAGIYRIIVKIKMISSMDAIVFQTEIGTTVDVSQV
jgi:phage tail sheath protein FI